MRSLRCSETRPASASSARPTRCRRRRKPVSCAPTSCFSMRREREISATQELSRTRYRLRKSWRSALPRPIAARCGNALSPCRGPVTRWSRWSAGGISRPRALEARAGDRRTHRPRPVQQADRATIGNSGDHGEEPRAQHLRQAQGPSPRRGRRLSQDGPAADAPAASGSRASRRGDYPARRGLMIRPRPRRPRLPIRGQINPAARICMTACHP